MHYFEPCLKKMSLPTSSAIQLKTGEQYTLVLKARLTAGYQWTFSIDGDDIVSIGKNIKAQKEGRNMRPGESAEESFVITALQKGKATVHFRQVRVWET